ncbi:hypothetical protein B9Z19DRAFT_1062049 [Tuber borchii]|uniref:Uncharacterized protein n=1 Tax=Tuber borchii TaxID=42251 RepID=A0A2T7A3D9_TUBBO|nr:hypothetical protein B9Z19DRAFT_1062049 [Tuber borchii]
MASASPLPLRNASPADTPLPESPLPRTAALVDTNTGASGTILEKVPSTDRVTTLGDPPTRLVRVKPRSPTYSDSPSMGPRQPHPYHFPPSPLQTPPSTAIHPAYYQQTPQGPAHYLPPRPLHNYTSPRSEYGSQYAPSTNGHPQPRRSSFAQRYQAGAGVMNTPEHSHPLRRFSSQGTGSMYEYEDPIDDNPIYSGQSTSGTLSPSAPYDADPHGNIEGLIQRAQGALQSLTMPIHSLQHLCDRYRTVHDELERFQHIADEQEKDMRELQEKKAELEAVKIDLERNLDMSAADLDHLKGQLSNLEAEVQRLSEIIKKKDEEKSHLEQRVTFEKEAMTVEFQNWKRDTFEAHEADRRSIITAHDAEKRTMEAKFLSKQRSIEATHSTEKMQIADIHRASSKELEEAHANEIQRLKNSHKDELGMARDTHKSIVSGLEKNLRDSLEQLRADFSIERGGMQAVFDSEKVKLEEGFAQQKASLQGSFSAEKNSMDAEFTLQKEKIEERFSSQKRAAELQFNMEVEDLRQTCEAEKLEMQESLEAAKTKWQNEKEKITAKFDDEKAKLDQIINTLEDEKCIAENTNLSLSADKSALLGQKATLEDTVANLEVDMASLVSDAERQKSEWEEQKQKLEVEVKDLKDMRDSLKKEVRGLKEVIQRTAEEEEGDERKSRGDGYYTDAFTKLSKDIIDISKEFSDLPVAPSGRVIAELPPGLPCMLVNTDASRLIRMAYVQHIISKYLCHRIFQPFLFYLGKRYDKADSFFQAMSKQLREKSTRKEAIWRYYTLLAGYTGSNAKRTASVAAANVIEEIAGHVKPFADQNRMDVITSGISRIVKFAVETWRHARVEREFFTASISLDGTDESLWLGHLYEHEKPYAENPALVARLKSLRGRHEIILPLLPIFSREGTLPSLHRPGASLDSGVVFSKGIALYMDCLPALQRSVETSPFGSVPALPIDVELVTTQEKKRLSPVSEGEDEYKAMAADKEVEEKFLKEQAGIREKEEAERQVKEEAEAMVRREEERVAREEAKRLAAENAEREAREVANKAAAEETERIATELAEKEAADKLLREEEAAEFILLEQELARLALEANEERQECQVLGNSDCKHQADPETTAPNDKTPTEAALADNEAWGGDEEIERTIQQALANTQTAEDESLSMIDSNSVDRFVASPQLDTVSPDQGIAAPSIAGETEQTDDTVETALEQQPDDAAAPGHLAHSASLPQTPLASESHKPATQVVFSKLTRADNTEGANEKSTEEGEITTTNDEIQTTAQEGSTEDLQSAAESEGVTLPTAELGLVPLVAQPEGESFLDTITAETPLEVSTNVSIPELPPTQKHEINDKEENPAEAVDENLQQRFSETLVESLRIPPTNTTLEVDTNNPISSPEASDAALISVTDMAGATDASAPVAIGLVANGVLSGSTSEFPNPEEAPIEHPALRDITASESEASATSEPIAQDPAVEMEAVASATEAPKIEDPMIEELSAVATEVKELLLDGLEAAEDIKPDPKLTEPDPQIIESKGKMLGSGVKDSETEQTGAVAEPRAEEPIFEEPNAEEPAIKEPVPETEEPKAAVQESEIALVCPKLEAIELNDKSDQPETMEPSPEAEERKFQSDDLMPNTGDLKPEADETRPKPTSPIIGMARVGFSKSSLSDGKTSGPSPRKMFYGNLRHSASMSEKRNSPSITADEDEVEEELAEDSKLDAPESIPSTPTSPSPGPEGLTLPDQKTTGKQKRRKNRKGKSQHK